MDDKYRGYGIKLLGGGFQLYYDNKLECTYSTCYDDKENLQKAKNTIDSKYKKINKDVESNIHWYAYVNSYQFFRSKRGKKIIRKII